MAHLIDPLTSGGTNVRSSSRERKYTAEGREWQISQRQGAFRRAVSTWRQHSMQVEILVTSGNLSSLRYEVEALQLALGDIREIATQLDKLDPSPDRDAHIDELEDETYRLSKLWSGRVRHTESVASFVQPRSDRHSHYSGSMSGSDRSRKVDAVTKAAVLRTKLKYIELEARKRAELDKLKVSRELEIAEVEIEAIRQAEREEGECSTEIELPVRDSSNIEFVPDEHIAVSDQFKHNEVSMEHLVLQSPVSRGNPVADNCGLSNKQAVEDNSQSLLSRRVLVVAHNSPQRLVDGNKQNSPSKGAPVVDEEVLSISKHLEDNNERSLSKMTSSVHHYETPNVHPVDSNGQCVPRDVPVSNQSESVDVIARLVEQMRISRLPIPQPDRFGGDPLKYPAWKTSFHALISQQNIPDVEKMEFLKKYVEGPARECIEACFLISTPASFDDALSTLEERFGDSYLVASAFRDRLESWPRIVGNDGKGIQRLADFLRQCDCAMHSFEALKVLDDDRENQRILKKLPDWLVTRWARVVASYKEHHNTFPPFKEFATFMNKESKIACDPVTSLQAVRQREPKNDRKSSKGNSFLSSSKDALDISRSRKESSVRRRKKNMDSSRAPLTSKKMESPEPKRTDECCLCKGCHGLDLCSQFLKKSMEERQRFVKDNNICFKCLKTGHYSGSCKERILCSVCSKMHPTSLHRYVTVGGTESSVSASTQVVTHLSKSYDCDKASMIVPVWVACSEQPSREKCVYALLDTQSDTTFVLDTVVESLGIYGTETKLMLSTMTNENVVIKTNKIHGLQVRGYQENYALDIPVAYTRDCIPVNRNHIPTPEMARKWSQLEAVAGQLNPQMDVEVGLLIGYNCPRALAPREVIITDENGPYAQKTDLGWGIVGVVGQDTSENAVVTHRVISLEALPALCHESIQVSCKNHTKELVCEPRQPLLVDDFTDCYIEEVGPSCEDRKFMDIMRNGIHLSEGHYEMPLPFRCERPSLPNNRSQAFQRLMQLKKRLIRDEDYRHDYTSFMADILMNGYAERVPDTELEASNVWYIPHHGVYHPQRPSKIRVVFDCSASFAGRSLNRELLQGPPLMNSLVGVLCRFRLEHVAFTCDVKKMFFQFQVNEEDRDYLRFLWWERNDYDSVPVEFRMRVHLFGAISSPNCAGFGFRQIAADYEEFGEDVVHFICRDFYVDDGLKSVPTIQDALDLIKRTQALCMKGGLKLHKFTSNFPEVLAALDDDQHDINIKQLDLEGDSAVVPVERVLGVCWHLDSDVFGFRIALQSKPVTKRGILSTVSSVYDPLGFLAPVLLVGRRIIQDICASSCDWDAPVPDDIRTRWNVWLEDLRRLGEVNIQRCYKSKGFGDVQRAELHHFSDACSYGYGQCSYLRLVDHRGTVSCSFVFGKARVAPLKPVTIPRLELTAAVLSAKVGDKLKHELELDELHETYWSDSKVVLGYISNTARRFHVFVSNRVQKIQELTNPADWRYVCSEQNPADEASRGISVAYLLSGSRWFKGPDFLWEENIPEIGGTPVDISDSDPEVRRVHSVKSRETLGVDRFSRFSTWRFLCSAVAWCIRYMDKLKGCASEGRFLQVIDIQRAELAIVRIVQHEAFGVDLESVKKKGGRLYQLDPFVDECGVLRVGGRLKRASFPLDMIHPVILPQKGHVTELIIGHYHAKVAHSGRGLTLNEVRANGYWVVHGCSAVARLLRNCVTCRKLRAGVQEQKMSDLPVDRLTPAPPFTYCGVDFFGPWLIKEGRSEKKRYGVLFTCLACRAVHIEVAVSLDTSSFINALRRFLAIRGPIRELRSDRGTNFVGAARELSLALKELDQDQVRRFLLDKGCDLFEFKMNPPSASHMGGSWERLIRTIRSVLSALLVQLGTQLDDECLRTMMAEVSAIVNSRPLTVENLNDPMLRPLAPIQLLTMKSEVLLPPPGDFQKQDVYSIRRWRRVQYLVNQFWLRWRKEYIVSLQPRQKWHYLRRNMTIGDIVLIKDECLHRSDWRLGKVVEVLASQDGCVRKAKVQIGTRELSKEGKRTQQLSILERPVQKLVLVLAAV